MILSSEKTEKESKSSQAANEPGRFLSSDLPLLYIISEGAAPSLGEHAGKQVLAARGRTAALLPAVETQAAELPAMRAAERLGFRVEQRGRSPGVVVGRPDLVSRCRTVLARREGPERKGGAVAAPSLGADNVRRTAAGVV